MSKLLLGALRDLIANVMSANPRAVHTAVVNQCIGYSRARLQLYIYLISMLISYLKMHACEFSLMIEYACSYI